MQNESKRQKQIAKQIQKDLSAIFLKNQIGKDALVTISVVKASPDLSLARVYLSVFPPLKNQAVLSEVSEKSAYLRQELGKLVRHQFRKVPLIEYYIDNTEEENEQISSLIEGLDIPPPSEDKFDASDYQEDIFDEDGNLADLDEDDF